MSATIVALPGVDTSGKKPGRRAKRVYTPDTITQTITIEDTRPGRLDTSNLPAPSRSTLADDMAMCAVLFRTLAYQFDRIAQGNRR